jgi:predicted RNA-binding protein YlxR (DUF448 family)
VRAQPERTCIICRTKSPKRELIRVAAADNGGVVIDASGKGAGRGAYLCRRAACWTSPDRDRRLQHALKASLSPEASDMLNRWADNHRLDET